MYIYVRAMSEAQSELYRKITDKVDEIDEHIIKLCLYPHALEVNHWKKEIYSFLNATKKLRNTKRLPKYKFILKSLQIGNDMIDAYIYRVTHVEKDLVPIDIDNSEILQSIVKYQEWLSKELSTVGLVIPDDVYNKLSEITGCD